MKNINYKIVTIILSGILIVTYAWHWQDIFNHKNMNEMGDMNMGHKNIQMDMDEMTMNDMLDDMKGKTGKGLEKAFLLGMIPHHQGAVDMAKLLLQDKTVRPEFVKFANDIITAQEKEIIMQKAWLETLFK